MWKVRVKRKKKRRGRLKLIWIGNVEKILEEKKNIRHETRKLVKLCICKVLSPTHSSNWVSGNI